MARPNPGASVDDILSRQGPPNARTSMGSETLEGLTTEGSTPVQAAVVVGDLRMSSLLLKEAVRPSLFARYLVGFTEAVHGLANDFGGWFDKFTGDGFIAFWLYRSEDEVIASVPGFCQAILPTAESLVMNLKKNSRNFPVGVGLSIGIDSGPCELVRVGDSVTLLGSPIVGATRMVSGAHAGQALVNVGLGAAFETHRESLEAIGAQLERRVIATKEYPLGQEAYELEFATTSKRTREPTPSSAE